MSRSVRSEGTRLSALDASFLGLESSISPMHTGLLMLLDRPLGYGELLEAIRERLPAIPALTNRLSGAGSGWPTLQPDANFKLEYHVRDLPFRGATTVANITAAAARAFAVPLRRYRPLWEIALLRNEDGVGSAVLGKLHHCIADGISGINLVEALFGGPPSDKRQGARRRLDSRKRAVEVIEDYPMRKGTASLADNIRSLFGESIANPLGALLKGGRFVAGQLLDPPPSVPFNGPLHSGRRLGWYELGNSQINQIKRHFRCTANDVLLAVITGGLRSYLKALSFSTQGLRIKTLVPVSKRNPNHGHDGMNEVSGLIASLPVEIINVARSMREIVTMMRQLQSSGQARAIKDALGLINYLPAMAFGAINLLPLPRTVNTVCTNIPGPHSRLSVAGRGVRVLVPLLPLYGGVGLGFAAITYAGSLFLGISADSHRVTDLRPLLWGFKQTFSELVRLAAAAPTLSNVAQAAAGG